MSAMGYVTMENDEKRMGLGDIDKVSFALTSLGKHVQRSDPHTMFHAIEFVNDVLLPIWTRLPDAVVSGGPQAEAALGSTFYEYLDSSTDSKHAADFTRFMQVLANSSAAILPTEYNFGEFRTLVEAGGGLGQLTLGILKKYPNIENAIVFDLASVIQHAPKPSPDPRLSWQVGSFHDLESIPKEKDVYIINACLNNWDDEQVIAILRNLKTAMGKHPKRRIIIGDPTLRPNTMVQTLTSQDLTMLLCCGGRVRTKEELTNLIERSGLEVVKTIEAQFMIIFYETKAK